MRACYPHIAAQSEVESRAYRCTVHRSERRARQRTERKKAFVVAPKDFVHFGGRPFCAEHVWEVSTRAERCSFAGDDDSSGVCERVSVLNKLAGKLDSDRVPF
jgi:hypothetical protein